MLSSVVYESAAQTLKHQTTENHIALEAQLLPYLYAIQSKERYGALLKAFYGYFKPVEECIAQYVDAHLLADMEQRRKAAFILNDLAALQQSSAALPLAVALPQIKNIDQALGALYVLEGSTLGGRGITKMLLKNTQTGLTPEHLQFFNGYGSETGNMWTTFLGVLNARGNQADTIQYMVTAANETFIYFKNWLEVQLVHE